LGSKIGRYLNKHYKQINKGKTPSQGKKRRKKERTKVQTQENTTKAQNPQWWWGRGALRGDIK
jgi:hypothetical protein